MKRKRLNLFWLPVALLFSLWMLLGCTAGPVEDDIPETARLVEISFGKPDLGVPVVVSKAELPTPLAEGSTVRICGYFRGEIESVTSEVEFSATVPTFEGTYSVQRDGSLSPCQVDDTGMLLEGSASNPIVRVGVYDFYAVSPARKLERGGGNGNYGIFGIPHKEDVMTSYARAVTISGTSRVVTLETFQRQCALVVFKVVQSTDNAIPFNQLHATSLKISKVSMSGATLIAGEDATIAPTGGVVEEAGQVVFEECDFTLVNSSSIVGLNETQGVLLPKTSAPFDVEIVVQRDEKEATLNATDIGNIPLAAGNQYVFRLVVSNDETRLLMNVLPWNAEYVFTDNDVGGPPIGGYPPPDINAGTGITFLVAQWKDVKWEDLTVGGK